MGWPEKLITHNGVTLSVKGWAERLGISRVTLSARLGRYGMTPEQALTREDLRPEASGDHYPMVTVSPGVTRREHIVLAERALGRPLPKGAEVHHVDEDITNNAPWNLVICPDHAYHRLLHMRGEAHAACGHYHWRRCMYCKTWGDPDDAAMTVTKANAAYHKRCNAAHQQQLRNARRAMEE